MKEHTPEEMREMLLAWQDWWQEYGSEWYMETYRPQNTKPPFLISGNKMYNKWICSEPKLEPKPVMKNGKLENFMPQIGGKSFRCDCTCNVFHKPNENRPELYECNGCGERYIGE
jgi:hypothetical protein